MSYRDSNSPGCWSNWDIELKKEEDRIRIYLLAKDKKNKTKRPTNEKNMIS